MTTELIAELKALEAESSPFATFDAVSLGHVFCMPEDLSQKVFASWARLIASNSPQPIDQAIGRADATHSPMEVDDDGVATIRVSGVMAKNGDLRWGVASTLETRKQIATARHSKEIQGALAFIDSPGGTAAGTFEAAEDLANLAKVKPVWGFGSDCIASAAFWFGSQAQKLFANETALVGSIGTYSVVPDFSKFFEEHGVTVNVFRAGKFKGMGTFGTAITDEQRDEFQRIVAGITAPFVKGVAKARGIPIERVREELADGRVHVARQALALGLIDGVQSWAETRSQFSKHIKSLSPGRSKSAMSQTLEGGPVAATIHELEQAFPKADASFHLRCLKSNLSVASAQGVYATEIQSQLDAVCQERDALKTKCDTLQAELDAEKAKPKLTRPGASAMADSGNPQPESSGDAVANWNAAVAEEMKGGKSKADAVCAVVKGNPDLHKAFLAATQPRR